MTEPILRVHQLAELIGVHRTTLWRWEQAGTFPLRRSLGPNSIGWLESEITAWVESRPVVEAPVPSLVSVRER